MIGIIYKLVNSDDKNFIYIGSTTNLHTRLIRHKSNKHSVIHSLNLDINKYEIIELSKYEVVDKQHLLAYEQLYINKFKNNNNRNNPFKIKYLYDLSAKDAQKQYRKKWHNDNRDKELKRLKESYLNNKEQIQKRHLEYYYKNKEKIAEKRKEWRQNNKEKIAERLKEKMECECGVIIVKRTYNQHCKTKRHIKLIS
jgi:predicted GIY-YIG superfamily endonuclease